MNLVYLGDVTKDTKLPESTEAPDNVELIPSFE
jgi:hypothetical protein